MVKITTLIENKKGEHLGLQNEHGLSFFVEIDNKKILFDSGQSDNFLNNARKLDINLSQIDSVILSHGHYDHTGGIKPLIKEFGRPFSLYAHPDIFIKKYRVENESKKFIGNGFDENWLIDNNIKINYVKEDVRRITNNAYLISNFDRVSKYEKDNPLYQVENGNDYIIDDFHDEVSMVLQTCKGLVILLGCSHVGIENIMRTVINRIGKNIYAVIGGTHLVSASLERIQETIEFIKKIDINLIGVSHCTGETAVLEFAKAFNDRYFYNCTGTTLQFA